MWMIEHEARSEFNNGLFRGDVAVGATVSAEELLLTSSTFSRIKSDRSLFLLVEDGGTDEVLTLTKTLGGDNASLSIGGEFGDNLDVRLATTGDIQIDGDALGFFGASPVGQTTVSGSRDNNGALAALLVALANYGIIVDNTVAS